MSYEGTQEELEDMLAGGGPTWDRILREIVQGGPDKLGTSVGIAMELEGFQRHRVKIWLSKNMARKREVQAAEEIRDERVMERLKEENLKVALAPLEGPGAVPISSKVKALENHGRDYGLFKDDGMSKLADSLENILARAALRAAETKTIDEKPVLRVAEGGNGA
jgi:hypothetical protein